MITTFDDPRIEVARRLLGDVRLVADPALPGHLLRLVDVDGHAYLAKQHRRRDRYENEQHAYRVWSRYLSGHVPELIGCHDSTRTLLFTAAPGGNGDHLVLGSEEEVRAHHAAGTVLGTLHRATMSPMTGAIGAELAQRLRAWAERADQIGLLTRCQLHRLLDAAESLAVTHMDSAVCHLDYQPRNWVVSTHHFVVCDLEHMRRDARLRDFARMEFRRWQTAPHLREAFFDGYGDRPTADEQQLLETFGTIETATALVRGHEQCDTALVAHGRTVLARLG